jgi:hypothetical protein
MDFEELIKKLIPDPEECMAKARQLRQAHPDCSDEKLAHKAISQVKVLTAAMGGMAGAVANPVAMVPAAAVEMGIVLDREAKLAGVIAVILEPSIVEDPDAFSADIIGILFPNAVSQALREVAVRAGQATTRTLIRKYISKDVLKLVIRFAAKYLGLKLTQRALITKSLPLVGAAIGAGWNWVEVERLGQRSIRYYLDKDATVNVA